MDVAWFQSSQLIFAALSSIVIGEQRVTFFMCFQLIQTILHQNHRVEFQALHLSRRLSLDMEIRLQYDPSPSTNARGSTTT